MTRLLVSPFADADETKRESRLMYPYEPKPRSIGEARKFGDDQETTKRRPFLSFARSLRENLSGQQWVQAFTSVRVVTKVQDVDSSRRCKYRSKRKTTTL